MKKISAAVASDRKIIGPPEKASAASSTDTALRAPAASIVRKGKTAAPVTYHTLVLQPRPGLGTKGKPSVGEKPTTR